MRILGVSEKFYPDLKGGGELSAYLLLKELAKKHEIHVVTSGNREEVLDRIQVHGEFEIPFIKGPIIERVSGNSILWLRILDRLRKYSNFDLIHAFNMSSIPSCIILGKKLKIPVTATINDHWATCFYRDHWRDGQECINCNLLKLITCIQSRRKDKRPSRPDIPFIRFNLIIRKLAVQRVNRIVAVSNRVKEILVLNGISDEKIDVIANTIANKPKYTEIGNSVVYLGRLEEGKGLDILITAMSKIEKELIIVGDGSIRPRLEKLAINNGNIKFVGWISPKNISRYYADARMIVCPFEREEPLSRIFLESLAAGRPVITTNIGGAPDIIDNQVGILVPPNNEKALTKAIQSLFLNRKKAVELGLNGVKRIKDGYTPKIIAGKYEIVYKKLLDDSLIT